MVNKRGLSDVITTVLIILLTLAAIVLIWTFLQPTIQKGVQSVPVQSACLQLQVDPVACVGNAAGGANGVANVTYKYASGDIDPSIIFTKVKVISTYSDGTAVTNDTTNVPAKYATANLNNVGVSTETTKPVISIAPVLTSGGKDYTCSESTTKVSCS